MKRTKILLLLLVLVTPLSLYALLVRQLTDLDKYLNDARTVFIGECLPIDEDPTYRNVCRRKVRVLYMLQGTLKKGDVIHVLSQNGLVPTRVYFIYSASEALNDKGELDAATYEPDAVEITLWGEIPIAEREKRIAWLIRQLEGKTLRDQVLYVFRHRYNDLVNEEKAIKLEMELLNKAFKVPSTNPH
jgi:hypothetical protein